MKNNNIVFPSGTLEVEKAMVLKHKKEFANLHGTLHQKSAANSTTAYLPVSQLVDTII